ncbi:phage major capsid family protein [Streptomyces sp. enrichment culture]|uniref:phage major capsid family protein n=1 Tax=Streptomyces sp. enrichment culture TaxID=1795815 RepID=UPI003F56A47C
MAINATTAADHLAQRDNAMTKLKALHDKYGENFPAGAQDAEARLLAEVEHHDGALRGLVGDAAAHDAYVTEVRATGAMQRPDSVQRRSLDDVRVLGMPIARGQDNFNFVERSADAFDAIDNATWNPAPVMLAEAPNGSALLGRIQAFPFGSRRGYAPIVPQLTAAVAGRNEPLGVGAIENGEVATFDTVKVAAYVKAQHDDVMDYPQLDASIDAAILSALGAGVDDLIINGGADADVTVNGLMDVGTSTVAALDTAGVLGAIARVKAARATPDAIVVHPDTEAALLGAIDGALLAKLPEFVALPSVPADTVIVASLSNVGVALRENLQVASATHHPELFSADQIAFAGRARVGDVVVANAAHVQIVKPV